MKLSDLIRDYRPLYPANGSWEDTKRLMLEDRAEGLIVEQLVKELRKFGEFNEPVSLGIGVEETPDGEEIEYPCVANGTHRVVASMIAGAETIKVSAEPPLGVEDERFSSAEEGTYLLTELMFGPELSEEQQDELFGALRSFRLNEEIWLESSIMFGSTRGGPNYAVTIGWANELDDSHIAKVQERIIKQLDLFDYTKHLLHMHTSVENWDEEPRDLLDDTTDND